jgi:hypothetical protein
MSSTNGSLEHHYPVATSSGLKALQDEVKRSRQHSSSRRDTGTSGSSPRPTLKRYTTNSVYHKVL